MLKLVVESPVRNSDFGYARQTCPWVGSLFVIFDSYFSTISPRVLCACMVKHVGACSASNVQKLASSSCHFGSPASLASQSWYPLNTPLTMLGAQRFACFCSACAG